MKIVIPSNVRSKAAELNCSFNTYLQLEHDLSTLSAYCPNIHNSLTDELNKSRKLVETQINAFAKLLGCNTVTNMYWIDFFKNNELHVILTHQDDRVIISVNNDFGTPYTLSEEHSLYDALKKVYFLAYIVGWIKD